VRTLSIKRKLIEKDVAMKERGVLTAQAAVCQVIVVIALFATADVNAASIRDEQRCLALNLYFEARGEGRNGMIAVGWTVLNRIRSRDFPATPCAVVREGGEQPPCQFSWWCDGKSDRPRDRRSWNQAMLISAQLLTSPPPDPTSGALFFHSTQIRPPFKRPRTRTVRIGSHIFYR
jgi:spore germination cell wall hydrolase CwlJ-like protein